MPYPSIVEYNEAIQHPAQAFTDSELKRGDDDSSDGRNLYSSALFISYMLFYDGRIWGDYAQQQSNPAHHGASVCYVPCDVRFYGAACP
jgi:hypothetical protein